MLIVVAIIGILVAIAVPALNTAKKDAQDRKKEAVETAVATAKTRYVLTYKGDNQEWQTIDVDFPDIQPLLMINGKMPNSKDTLAEGTGDSITSLGTYPDPANPDDPSGGPIVWASDETTGGGTAGGGTADGGTAD